MIEFNILSLNHITCSGMCPRALYSALATGMFFGRKSDIEVRVDKGVSKPFFSIALPELEKFNVESRKAILLNECLAQTAEAIELLSPNITLSNIEKLIVMSSASSEDTDSEDNDGWQEIVKHSVNQHLPKLANKLMIQNVQGKMSSSALLEHIKDDVSQAKLVVTVDVLNSYGSVKQLSTKMDLLVFGGKAGVMPSEGAASCLVLPSQFSGVLDDSINVQTLGLDNNIKSQLAQLDFSINDTIVHIGTTSDCWATHWHGQTHQYYHKNNANDELIIYDQTQVFGFLGASNLPVAFSSASEILASPMTESHSVWLVEHQINSKNTQTAPAYVYKVARNAAAKV